MKLVPINELYTLTLLVMVDFCMKISLNCTFYEAVVTARASSG